MNNHRLRPQLESLPNGDIKTTFILPASEFADMPKNIMLVASDYISGAMTPSGQSALAMLLVMFANLSPNEFHIKNGIQKSKEAT